MKKLIALLVLLVVLTSTAIAEMDISIMSMDELLDLKAKINAELANRFNDFSEVLYTGIYEVGKDIEPGTYIFEILYDEHNSSGNLYIIDSMDEYKKIFNREADYKTAKMVDMYVHIGDKIHYTLEKGTVLVLDDCSVAVVSFESSEEEAE